MYTELINRFLQMHEDGILIAEEDGRKLLYVDEAVSRRFGPNLLGRPCHQALFQREEICPGCPALRLEAERAECWEVLRPGNPAQIFLMSGAVFPFQGRTVRVCRMQDVSDYMLLVDDVIDYGVQRLERAEQEGAVDALTGLENRNQLMKRQGEYARAGRLGVLYFDVDHMKEINDTQGHEAGDELLRAAGRAIGALAAEGVHAYRIGGDEFLIVAPDCEEAALHRLRERWDACQDTLENGDRVCRSVSCGFAWGEKGSSLEELMRQADVAMYTHKRRKKGTDTD